MANADSSSPNAADPAGCDPIPDGDSHWDDVAREWATRRPDRLWREFTDRLQIGLLDRCIDRFMPGACKTAPAALKTDLFDEVAGTGVIGHLGDRGFRTTGIDVSPVVVAEAKRRIHDLDAIVADVRELPFEDGSFDLVFSGSTLDHFDRVDDIGRAVREIVRVLRPSGTFVITLDNLRNPIVWLRNGPLLGPLRRAGVVPYRVGATLGPRALADLVADCGVEVLSATTILHSPRALAVWMSRWVEGRETKTRERFLKMLLRWEGLERWPTRSLSGYFNAIVAEKPQPASFNCPPSPPRSRPHPR